MAPRLSILIFTTFCAAGQSQTDPAEGEIRATRSRSNEAIRRHDLQAFATSLDSDCVMVRGNGVFVPSREAYIDLFRHDFADPTAVRYERIPDKVEISTAAPLAAQHGHWIGTHANGTRAYGGTYSGHVRRTEARRKIPSQLFGGRLCGGGPAPPG